MKYLVVFIAFLALYQFYISDKLVFARTLKPVTSNAESQKTLKKNDVTKPKENSDNKPITVKPSITLNLNNSMAGKAWDNAGKIGSSAYSAKQ